MLLSVMRIGFSFLFLLLPLLGTSLGWSADASSCRSAYLHARPTIQLPAITIRGSAQPDIVNALKVQIRKTADFFVLNLGLSTGEIKVSINGQNDLRTGYSFTDRELRFPSLPKIKRNGADSIDVIDHETFHLLACRRFIYLCPPNLGSDQDLQIVNEALADYFAYLMNPSPYFGRDYYVDKAYIRSYQTKQLMGLSEGTHTLANSLVKHLIDQNVSLKQIQSFLDNAKDRQSIVRLNGLSKKFRQAIDKELSYSIEYQAENTEQSKLNRYRLEKEQALVLKFIANANVLQDYPDVKVVFTSEDGEHPKYFEMTYTDPMTVSIQTKENTVNEKLLATYVSKGSVIGAKAFYLGPVLK